ncbi:MAG: serine protease [Chloroflexota bacterium]
MFSESKSPYKKSWLTSCYMAIVFGFGLMPLSDLQANERAARSQERIIAGVEATSSDARFPVSIRNSNGHFCGGVLVSPKLTDDPEDTEKKIVTDWTGTNANSRWILTAAHCVNHAVADGSSDPTSALTVLSGSRKVNDVGEGVIQKVEKIYVHPDYDEFTLENDIALLHLEISPKVFDGNLATDPIRLSIRLPRQEDFNWLNRDFTALNVAGWGTPAEGSVTTVINLQRVQVPLFNHGLCQDNYGFFGDQVTDTMLCAGFISGEFDACQGDSGGPIFYRPTELSQFSSQPILVGVVSWGRGCGRADLPGIYTSVSHFLPWLSRTVESAING